MGNYGEIDLTITGDGAKPSLPQAIVSDEFQISKNTFLPFHREVQPSGSKDQNVGEPIYLRLRQPFSVDGSLTLGI